MISQLQMAYLWQLAEHIACNTVACWAWHADASIVALLSLHVLTVDPKMSHR